jgi:hypothetical protein
VDNFIVRWMMHLLKNLRRKYNDVVELVDYVKWLFKLRNTPLPVGTILKKEEGQQLVYYQVVGHKDDSRSTEILEEIRRDNLK